MRNICRTLTISLCTALLAAGTLTFAEADARSISYDLNIPSEDLTAALQSFAIASHHKLLYKAELTAGKISRALKGHFTAQEAMEALLSGTGLSYEITGSSVVLIKDRSGGKTSELQEEGTTPRSPRAVFQSSSGQPILLAQSSQTSAGPQAIGSDQDSEKKKQDGLTEIVVTGTHLQGAAPVGAPIRTIDSAAIEQSGYTSTDQLIQSLPEAFRGGASGASPDAIFTRGANRGANTTFGSGVNLRGLGTSATLVLINGHRVAPSGSGYFVDISTIPLSAIDHIDVLTDGASAIYGTDAIGGVVNIVLKNNVDGVEIGGRYGATTDGGFSTYDGNALIGSTWTGGGATLTADYFNQGGLDVSDRSFTSSIASPTSLYPSTRQIALSGTIHQEVGEKLDFHGDMQYSDSWRHYIESYALPVSTSDISVPRWSGSVGTSYRLAPSWKLSYDVSSGVGTERSTANQLQNAQPAQFLDQIAEVSKFTEHNVEATGDVFALPAGNIKLAAGATYLGQAFSGLSFNPTSSTRYGAGRHVASAYGELLVPVLGDTNAIPLMHRLTVSVAGRFDHYSDFGGTTNPKYGISWFPVNSLEFRASYSTSFRAPAAGAELVDSLHGTTSVLLFPLLNPLGTAKIPVLFAAGAVPDLQPERARNLSLGATFKPEFLERLELSLNYYSITYTGQLASAPFSATGLSNPALAPVITKYPSSAPIEAFVSSAVSGGAQYFDATAGAFGPNPLASTVYLYDIRIANLAKTETSGFDFGAKYRIDLNTSRIDAALNATYIDKFDAQLTPAAPQLSQVNTVGYPAAFRARAELVWSHDGLAVAGAENYVSKYKDTSTLTVRDVGSYSTIDLTARYTFAGDGMRALNNVSASLSVTNVLDRAPPYVESGALSFPGSHYDPANASPLGRLVSITLQKRW